MRSQPEICAGYLHAREGRPTVTSSHLGATEAARCGAQIDAASPAFVLSLGNSKSIFLTFFYLLAQTSLPPRLPVLLLLLLLFLYLPYSSDHLYAAQTRVSYRLSLSPTWLFSPLASVSPVSLTSSRIAPPPLPKTPHPLICFFYTPPSPASHYSTPPLPICSFSCFLQLGLHIQ